MALSALTPTNSSGELVGVSLLAQLNRGDLVSIAASRFVYEDNAPINARYTVDYRAILTPTVLYKSIC
jgi:hypothetical protein